MCFHKKYITFLIKLFMRIWVGRWHYLAYIAFGRPTRFAANNAELWKKQMKKQSGKNKLVITGEFTFDQE